ncbi:type III secretion apparatus assembly protein SctX [Endozoicomonas numazuensis]|uniref:Uncharacterized protein n=1 Tax=Endozoicomonas numazuensis TaxID=1137799 RepID=A0A081NKA7_9GAMM|nr:hypothetical protein [Endozoicomonas numazuensis]KEQ18880.1 hypothetical protein GZ78_02150 [Endozoicomonas numazuensis]
MDVSFKSGLSGISFVNSDFIDKDFPKDKSSFKPSGDSISAHFWKALEMGRTFQNREKKYALSLTEKSPSLSPDEHHMMRDMALSLLSKKAEEWPEVKAALDVLKESKELQEYLTMTRNVLVAG